MERGSVLSAGSGERPGLTVEQVLARFARAAQPRRRSAPRLPGVPTLLPPEARGDHDLNPDMLPERPLTAAAVLILLVERPGGLTVLFTRRTEHLANHAGQISFPGGCIDPGDADAAAAALREAREEVGIPVDRVRLIGRLDTYVTRTGFEIAPIVGLIAPPFPVVPDPFEVAEIFEVPLEFLADPANHRRESRIYNGRTRHFFAIEWERHYIWGATAGMLVNLAELLASLPAATTGQTA